MRKLRDTQFPVFYVLHSSGYHPFPESARVIIVARDAAQAGKLLAYYGSQAHGLYFLGAPEQLEQLEMPLPVKVLKVFLKSKEEVIRYAPELRRFRCLAVPVYPLERLEDVTLITSMGIAADVLYHIDGMEPALLEQLLAHYLRHPALLVPLEPFHAILMSKLFRTPLQLWRLFLCFPRCFRHIMGEADTEQGVRWPGFGDSGASGEAELFLEKLPHVQAGCMGCRHFHICFGWGKFRKNSCANWRLVLSGLQEGAGEIDRVRRSLSLCR